MRVMCEHNLWETDKYLLTDRVDWHNLTPDIEGHPLKVRCILKAISVFQQYCFVWRLASWVEKYYSCQDKKWKPAPNPREGGFFPIQRLRPRSLGRRVSSDLAILRHPIEKMSVNVYKLANKQQWLQNRGVTEEYRPVLTTAKGLGAKIPPTLSPKHYHTSSGGWSLKPPEFYLVDKDDLLPQGNLASALHTPRSPRSVDDGWSVDCQHACVSRGTVNLVVEWDSATYIDDFFMFFPQSYSNQQWFLGARNHLQGFKLWEGVPEEGKRTFI